MWAAYRDNLSVVELLMDYHAQIDLEDEKGWNALDLAIIRMNYKCALYLKQKGLRPRPREMYENNLW